MGSGDRTFFLLMIGVIAFILVTLRRGLPESVRVPIMSS